MTKNLTLFTLLFCHLLAMPCQALEAHVVPVSLHSIWQLNGLDNPESVALSAGGDFLYVSNVNGEADAQDGNGYLSRISLDGKLLEQHWSDGFDGPKGIVLADGKLWVADISQVIVVSLADGAILQRIPAPGAKFLNDIAVSADGTVLVSDSATSRIYSVRDGTAGIWLEDELLASINGLLVEPAQLTVTTMAGRLLAVDYDTRAIRVLAEGLGDADGIAPLSDGRYLVSEWPGLMHVVYPDGTHETVLDSREEKIKLNDFLLIGDTLYQPNWTPGSLTAYRLGRH